VPATALRCRVCETQFPLDPIGVCARCFGPLDPVYDRDEQRRTVTRESIAAGPQSIWRYAPLLPVAPPEDDRLPVGLTGRGGWGDTVLALPDGATDWHDVVTDTPVVGAAPRLDTLLARYPVAVLVRPS